MPHEIRFFARRNLPEDFIAKRITQILGYDQSIYPIEKTGGYKWDLGGNDWKMQSAVSLGREPTEFSQRPVKKQDSKKYEEFVLDYRYGGDHNKDYMDSLAVVLNHQFD